MRTTLRTLAATAIALAALAGCSSDDDASGDDGAAVTDEAGDDAAGDGATLTIEGFAFPDGLTVAAGEEITVVNADSANHTVTSADDPSGTEFDLEISGGQEITFAVDEPGTYPFVCRIHPSMSSVLTVEG